MVLVPGPVQVWDVQQEAPVANYRGHTGYLLSVDWSPVDPDLVWTGGKDFTLQEWSVSRQEFTNPPKGTGRDGRSRRTVPAPPPPTILLSLLQGRRCSC